MTGPEPTFRSRIILGDALARIVLGGALLVAFAIPGASGCASNSSGGPNGNGSPSGTLGAPCSGSSECESGSCLLVSPTERACSARCDEGECLAGWSCDDFGGQALCLCDAQGPETCNESDDDCDGRVDEACGQAADDGPPREDVLDAGPATAGDGRVCECEPDESEAESRDCESGGTQGRSRSCRGDCAWDDWSEWTSCECGAGEMMCGDACTTCPTGDGLDGVACEDSTCIASACREGYIACESGCCAWSVGTIDFEGDRGRFPAIAFDGETTWVAHVGLDFTVSGVFVTRTQDDGWVTEPIAENEGSAPSIAIDDAGTIHLAYHYLVFDAQSGVRYVSGRPGAWTTATVEENRQPLLEPSIALLEGVPRVVYKHLSQVTYAGPAGDAWGHMELPQGGDDAGQQPDILIDGSQPHIVHHSSSGLHYATYDGDPSWRYEDISTGAARQPNLQLCGDVLTVAFHDVASGELRLARRTGSSWSVRTLSSVGTHLALVCDGTWGDVAYHDDPGGRLLHRRFPLASDDPGVSTVVDDSGNPGRFGVDLARSPSGELVVAYHGGGEDLRFGRLLP